jgi:hypothetical protein
MKFEEFYKSLGLPDDTHKSAMELAWKASATYACKKAVEISLKEMDFDQGASSAKIARQIMDEMKND